MILKLAAITALGLAIALARFHDGVHRAATLRSPILCAWIPNPTPPPRDSVWACTSSGPIFMADSVGIDNGPQYRVMSAVVDLRMQRLRDFRWEPDPADPRRGALVSQLSGSVRFIVDSETTRPGALLIRGPHVR